MKLTDRVKEIGVVPQDGTTIAGRVWPQTAIDAKVLAVRLGVSLGVVVDFALVHLMESIESEEKVEKEHV